MPDEQIPKRPPRGPMDIQDGILLTDAMLGLHGALMVVVKSLPEEKAMAAISELDRFYKNVEAFLDSAEKRRPE